MLTTFLVLRSDFVLYFRDKFSPNIVFSTPSTANTSLRWVLHSSYQKLRCEFFGAKDKARLFQRSIVKTMDALFVLYNFGVSSDRRYFTRQTVP